MLILKMPTFSCDWNSQWLIKSKHSLSFIHAAKGTWTTNISVPYVTVFCCSGMEYIAGLAGVLLRGGMRFYCRILFMGFLPQNTLALTIVHILVTFHNVHTLTIFHDSIFFSHFLFLMWHDIVRSVHPFSNNFVVTYIIILIIFFLSEIDFYCITLTFWLQ